MKKVLSILVITMAFGLFGMQNVNAQATVDVTWNNNCSSCPQPGDFYYRVDIAVVDQCGTPHQAIHTDYNIEDEGEDESSFTLPSLCVGETSDCYLVVAAVKKLCPDGQGGFTVLCEGKFSGLHVSCQQLSNPNFTIDCPVGDLN